MITSVQATGNATTPPLTPDAITHLLATQPALRISEQDADYLRLKRQTVKRLDRALRNLVANLTKLPPAEHQIAVSAFIQTMTDTLKYAYLTAHAEGQRDYHGTVSLLPATMRGARITEPDDRTLARRLAFYVPSVAKMASEALRAYQVTAARRTAFSDAYRGILRLAGRGSREGDSGARAVTSTVADLDGWLAALGPRVDLQAEVVWSGLQDGYLDAGADDPANPFALVWWVLGPVKTMHCGDCPRLAAASPYTAPGSGGNELHQTPGDGRTACGAGCHCEVLYASALKARGLAADDKMRRMLDQRHAVGDANWRTFWPVGMFGPGGREAPPQGSGLDPAEDSDIAGLNVGQKRALDEFRAAYAEWDRVRGALPPAPRMFGGGPSGMADSPFEQIAPLWDSLTPQQQAAVWGLYLALDEWHFWTAMGLESERDPQLMERFETLLLLKGA